MPGKAMGRTTCQMVCQRDAPSASAPSRRENGTVRSASREAMMMMGRIKRAIVHAPAMTLRPMPEARTNSSRPNRP